MCVWKKTSKEDNKKLGYDIEMEIWVFFFLLLF
jgi:hypothetical protein